MNRQILACSLLFAALAAPNIAQEIGVMSFPEGAVQHVVRAADTPWGPCPATLPPGCELALLEGNLGSADLFTVRFRTTGDFHLAAHTHPKDERVTILEGTVAVAFGLGAQREEATEFGPGDYYVNARDAVHTVWLEGPTILQITGIGPWEANPVSDEPTGE